MSPKSPKTAKTFRVVLERVDSTPPWVIARLPFDPKKAWPEWSTRRVRGTLNGFEFQTSLLSTKGQGYWFVVYKKMLTGACAKAGDKVEVRLEPDLEGHLYAEPKELTIVSLSGTISLDDLADLGGQFGIPKVELPKNKGKEE